MTQKGTTNHFSILDSPMDWRSIFDLVNVMMLFLDRKGNVKLINLKGCEILGYPENEIVGKNWFDSFIPNEFKEKVKKVFHSIMSGNLEPFIEYENYVTNRAGEKRFISWHNTYLADEYGNIQFTLSSGVDITEELRIRDELKKSEEKYRKSFEQISDALFFIDKKGTVLDINQKTSRVIGRKKSELVGMSVFDFIPSDQAKLNEGKIEEVLRRGSVCFNTKIRKANGKIVPINVSAKVIDKRKGLILGTFRDVRKCASEPMKLYEKTLKENDLLKQLNQAYHQKIKSMKSKIDRLENRLRRRRP